MCVRARTNQSGVRTCVHMCACDRKISGHMVLSSIYKPRIADRNHITGAMAVYA